MTTNVLVVPGSLRSGSHNANLARVAARKLTELGCKAELLDLSRFDLPLYHGDLERNEGVPDGAGNLAEKFRSADAVLLISPEYNAGVSPLLKNAIDWASRVKDGRGSPYKNRIFALASASPGRFGGMRGLISLRQTLELGLGALVIPEQLLLASAHQALDTDGQFADPATETQLTNFLQAVLDRAGHHQA